MPTTTTTTTYTVTWNDGTTDVFATTSTCTEATDGNGVVQWVSAANMTKNGENPGQRSVHLGLARDWSKTVVVS